jgi:uncharacterized protein (DUF1330 family)
MAIIVVANIKIADLEQYKKSGYLEQAGKTATMYGGTYIVRAGRSSVIEGSPKIERVIMIEFSSEERFLDWYNSEEYAPWKKVRHALAESDMFIIEKLTDEQQNDIGQGTSR